MKIGIATQERVIWAIGGVKFKKKNGQMIIPPDDPQYKKVEFVTSVLNNLNVPYKREWTVSKVDKRILLYRFVADDNGGGIPMSSDDIYAIQNLLQRIPQ